MTQDKLDHLIKKSFELERDFSVDESAWDALSERLDQDHRPNRLVFFWWILGGVLSGLLGFWIFTLSTQLQTAMSRIESLEKTASKQSILSVLDTCVETITHYQYDTLHKTVLVEMGEKDEKGNRIEERGRIVELEETKDETKERFADLQHEEGVEMRINSLVYQSEVSQISFLTKRKENGPEHLLPKIRKKSNIHWEAGIIYGNSESPSFFNKSPNLDQDSTFTSQSSRYHAFRLGIGIGQKFLISISPGLETIDYKSNKVFPFPYYQIGPSEYTPSLITIKQKAWRLPIEIRYIPHIRHRFQPFFEAGILAQAKLKSNVNILYTTELPYIDPSYEINHNLNQSAFRLNQLTAGLGLIYRFNSNISAQITYQNYFKLKPDAVLQSKYAIQGQLAYRFN